LLPPWYTNRYFAIVILLRDCLLTKVENIYNSLALHWSNQPFFSFLIV